MKKTTLATFALAIISAAPALAQEAAPAAVEAGSSKGLIGLAAALTIAIAALGGTLAQGRAASAALDGIARNPAAQPKVFTPMIIGMALIESLVIFALLVAFNLAGKI